MSAIDLILGLFCFLPSLFFVFFNMDLPLKLGTITQKQQSNDGS